MRLKINKLINKKEMKPSNAMAIVAQVIINVEEFNSKVRRFIN